MRSLDECAELLEALPEPLLLATANGLVCAANRAAEALLGAPRAALLRRPLALLFDGLADPPAAQAGAAALPVTAVGGGPLTLSLSALAGGLLVRVTPPAMPDEAGRLRRELNELEHLARVGRVTWLPDENRMEWSAQFARLAGIAADTRSSYAAFLARIHPDDREPLLHAMARTRREHRSFCLRQRLVRRDGELREVLTRGNWRRAAEGGPTLVMRVQDITARVIAERSLAELAHRNALLLESTGEGILGIDNEGRCSFVNPAALAMLGFTRDELLAAHSVHALVHHSRPDGSPYPEEECPMHRVLVSGAGVQSIPELLFTKSGDSFPAAYSAHPIVEHGAIRGAVVVFRNEATHHALTLKMDFLASHDSLTGLVNRHHFEQRLGEALLHSRAEGANHVICYIDLDQFKIVNDSCGHAAGDELLRQLAALLRARLRPQDLLARLGGDEFGVLFEATPLPAAIGYVEAMRAAVQEFRFLWEQQRFALDMSIGMVTIDQTSESAGAALSAADTACYVAKLEGRGRIHLYHDHDTGLMRHRGEMLWVGRLREALEHDSFSLRYQPIVPLRPVAGAGECYEILLDLCDPAGNRVPPSAFLPAAERFNLVPAIDRWVVSHVLAWLRSHPRQLARLELCTINLSGNTLGDEASLEFIVAELARGGVPPERIGFEITETAAIANLGHALGFMHRLAALGCRFALDDFGSGMSSFGYLKHLPVDFLKIDGAFVRDIAEDQVDRAMVKAINHVGQVMNIRTIAEHLESAEVLEVLREIGVDYGQGFRTGAPRELSSMPA